MKLKMIKKKYLILFITLVCTVSTAFAADVSRLYRVKNSQPDNVNKVLQPFISRNFPDAIRKNNTYILENKHKGLYYVLIIANKAEDCYFYYMSNNDDESLRKELVKTLKNNDFKVKTVRDSSLKSFFYGEAYTSLAHSDVNTYLLSGVSDKKENKEISENIIDAKNVEYDFSDEAQARFEGHKYSQPQNFVKIEQSDNYNTYPNEDYLADAPIDLVAPKNNQSGGIRLPKIESSNSSYQGNMFDPNYRTNYEPSQYEQSNNVLTGSVVHISEGSTFTAALLSDISSESLVNNDGVSAELDRDWVYNGQLIAPEGSVLIGRAIETRSASFAMKNGQVGLLFDEIMTPDGDVIPLKTNKVFIVGNSSRALNVTKRVVGGAATGLLLSAVSMMMGVDPTRALITGASIGAGAGAISAISSKGEEISVIEGTQLEIMLTEPLTVQLYRQ